MRLPKQKNSMHRQNRKKREKKFHSLRHQISVIFMAVLLFAIFAITAVNGIFLEKYYITKKVQVLLDAKDDLAELNLNELMQGKEILESTEGSKYDDSLESSKKGTADSGQDGLTDEISRACSRNNLSWVVTNKENSRWYGWGENERLLREKLFGYVYDLDEDKNHGRVLEETDDCVIQQVHDRFAGMDYVECWGWIDDDNCFLIRTPLESIRESAAISNKFYFWVGAVIVILSGLFVMVFTKKITKPISELTDLSQKMSNLDFEAKYQSRVGNEIDVLGDNFNRMSSQLESTISELKSANLKLQKDIEDKIKIDDMRKEFLDNVSHELKTPIALIQGYAEGLKENISDDPESREFYCDVIMDESAKMNKLVKNLLTLNQLESGKDAAVMERFDIVSLIRGVLESMNIMIQQKEASVIFEEQEPIYVWADEFKVEEVVTNYTSNALNHLEGKRQIEIKIIPVEEKIRVSVFNTGSPIPEEDVPNLWNKFYKVDKARTREYGGSGIGLSIVKAIMEGMEQQYGVQNYENGVEFWFTLDRR